MIHPMWGTATRGEALAFRVEEEQSLGGARYAA
jgi:hypothetical protein